MEAELVLSRYIRQERLDPLAFVIKRLVCEVLNYLLVVLASVVYVHRLAVQALLFIENEHHGREQRAGLPDKLDKAGFVRDDVHALQERGLCLLLMEVQIVFNPAHTENCVQLWALHTQHVRLLHLILEA